MVLVAVPPHHTKTQTPHGEKESMEMWVITYKGKPAKLEKIYKVEKDYVPYHIEHEAYIAAPSKGKAIRIFLYHIGFRWSERTKGIDVKKFT